MDAAGTVATNGDELELVPDAMVARVDGRSVRLTVRELALLEALVRARGRVVERKVLYGTVWGGSMPRRDRSVDVCIRKLRGKLESVAPGRQFIHTHYGIGYRFDPETNERVSPLGHGFVT